MAKKLIMVVAIMRGQLANRKWVDENSPPFEIDEVAFSKRWMRKLSADEVKALKAAAEPPEDLAGALAEVAAQRDAMDEAGKTLSGQVATLGEENETLKAQIEKAASDLNEAQIALVKMTEERDAMAAKLEVAAAPPEESKAAKDDAPPSIAGEKKPLADKPKG